VYLLARYLPLVVARELLRCERWTPDERAGGLFVVGMLGSAAFLPLALTSYVWWLLTGGGPVRRFGFARRSFVSPFGALVPPDVIAALRRRAAALADAP
jgi:hypothetical protein